MPLTGVVPILEGAGNEELATVEPSLACKRPNELNEADGFEDPTSDGF